MVNEYFRRLPKYYDDQDYNTNAPSYYDDLARKQKLIELLSKKIWEYEEKLDLTLEDIESRVAQRFDEWDLRIEKFPDNVESLLQDWVSDGTLDHIINDTIFSWKADQSELDKTNEQLAKTIKVFNVMNYGAIGNGLDDDTSALNSAITDLESVGGGTLYIPKGRYKITSTLTITSNVKIMGDETNKPTLDFSGVSGYAIVIRGNIKQTVNLSVDTPVSTSVITVPSAESIEVGDLLSIQDVPGTWTIDPPRNYSAGQLNRVVKVSGNDITLDDQTETAYTSQASVTVYNTVQCDVSNIAIYRDVEMGGGVRIVYSDEFLVENVSTNNTTTEGISCSFSTNGKIRHNQATNHGYDTQIGYGVVAYNSTNIHIYSNTFYRGRKGVDVSGSIPSRHITIENNVASDMSSSGFGPHGTAQYISIINNTVTGFKTPTGINLRGKDITADGNIVNVRTNPIALADVAGSVVITNNVSSGRAGNSWTSYGVRYFGGVSDLDLLAIKNNVFEGSGTNGMIKLESDSTIGTCDISSNTISTQFTSGVGIEAGLNQKINKLTVQSNQYNRLSTKEKNLTDNANINNLIFFGGEEPLSVVDATEGLVIPRVSVRPTSPIAGTVIIDTTIAKMLWWTGGAWRDATGIIVD